MREETKHAFEKRTIQNSARPAEDLDGPLERLRIRCVSVGAAAVVDVAAHQPRDNARGEHENGAYEMLQRRGPDRARRPARCVQGLRRVHVLPEQGCVFGGSGGTRHPRA
jgi:hypothetical protein